MDKILLYFALIGVGAFALTVVMILYVIYSVIYDYVERRYD